jgi:hypothetical protein
VARSGIPGRVPRGFVRLVLVALVLPACAPPTQVQKAGLDQDIARDINWELRKDRRLEEVSAYCIDRVVTLEGHVSDPPSLEEALRIARAYSRGAPVVSNLDLRPR